jgi:glyoxylase-like metal-dependent hydrolase (beta-lactamase superfamily II)
MPLEIDTAMRLSTVLLFLIMGSLSFAQSRFDDVTITETHLTDHVYMLEGSGGNIGLIIGEDGALLIDDQFAPLADKIKAKVKELNDGPIAYVANTHWHGDHTGGNETFGTEGATIIAHKNVRERMSTEYTRGDRVVPPSPAGALPVITYGEDLQLYFSGVELHAIHVDHAHTDGDAFIWMPKENVLHMGDCFFNKRFPYIDLNSGGSVNGAIDAVSAALLMVDEQTQIIPGHGPMANKADLEAYLHMLKDIRTRVNAFITMGKGLEGVDVSVVVEGYEELAWGFINSERLVEIFYNSLSTE